MASEPRPPAHDGTDLLDDALRDTVTAVRAVMDIDRPDYKRRCEDAAAALRGLLSVPTDRPGSWEASHVDALDEPLRAVLHVPEGADQ